MKSYIIVAALSVLTGGLSAQTSIEDVLRSVEANNKDLQANSQLVQSQKLEAKLDNNLPDPSVSYSHFWGNKEGMGFTGEFVASQSFDFPSVYVRKHKLTKAKSAGLDRQGMAFRQQILLQVKEVCLDLVLLNQQKNLWIPVLGTPSNFPLFMRLVWRKEMRISLRQTRSIWNY